MVLRELSGYFRLLARLEDPARGRRRRLTRQTSVPRILAALLHRMEKHGPQGPEKPAGRHQEPPEAFVQRPALHTLRGAQRVETTAFV